MTMMTKEIKKRIPALYSQEKVKDPLIHVKYFCPWNGWTWYATEYRPEEELFFGYVMGQCNEMGYFNLGELESITGPGGLKIERDLYFKPCRLSEIKKGD